MGQKRKASKARIGNLQAARGTLSDKRWKSGKQAAWAARKYQGHQVLPPDIFEELDVV